MGGAPFSDNVRRMKALGRRFPTRRPRGYWRDLYNRLIRRLMPRADPKEKNDG